MHRKSHGKSRFACAAFVGALTFTANANAGTLDRAASLDPATLDGCAELAAAASRSARLDVVRRVTHGRDSDEYWINADVRPAKKSYCRVRAGTVTEFRSFDGTWVPGYVLRPAPVARTVTFTDSRAADAACESAASPPPSNAGASLRND